MFGVHSIDFQFFLMNFGWQKFLEGFYYFKYLEYPLVFNNLNFKDNVRYLDIGSGNSIFPLFVLKKTDAKVHIIDDCSIIGNFNEYYKRALHSLNLQDSLGKDFFIHQVDKGTTNFPFPSNYFDRITCISTIEHIKGNGDSKMMKTISRILKKGGKAVITFPFSNGDFIIEDNPEGIGFFQRKYNVTKIQQRIIRSSKLKTKKVIYFGERFVNLGKKYSRNKFKKIKCFLPFVSSLLWRKCHQYRGKFRDYHEPALDKKGVGVACLVFTK